jgi:hypothetical protein
MKTREQQHTKPTNAQPYIENDLSYDVLVLGCVIPQIHVCNMTNGLEGHHLSSESIRKRKQKQQQQQQQQQQQIDELNKTNVNQ